MIKNKPYNIKEEDIKRTVWAIELYPDSAKDNWKNILKNSMLKYAISPLHEYDINDEGEPLKPHYHIMILFSGGARPSQVYEICNLINAPDVIEIVRSKKLYYEYLYHKNDPEKYQYNKEDIIHINSTYLDWSDTAYKDILNYIDDNNIYSIYNLTKKLRNDDNDNLLEYVTKNSYFVNLYIKDSKNKSTAYLNDIKYFIDNYASSVEEANTISYEVLNKIRESCYELLKIFGKEK